MKADLSRNTFDRSQHYSAVRLQQGRIVTDADWNEQADITGYRAQRQARDIIGTCGGPLDAAGYALLAETNALAVHALAADRVWVLAQDGVLLVTGNGGIDWALIDLGTAEHLRALASVGNVGWIVGDAGVVRKSTDAGATWNAQNAGTVHALRGIAASDANHAWAVGDGGIIVSTADGGVNWSLAQTAAARLYAVAFVNNLNGITVGQNGVILSTADGGQTWTTVTSNSVAHLRALARNGNTRFWTAGQDGTILLSTDGGTTWLPCSTPTTANLLAIAFLDASEGWAVGENGTVLHSLDGGVSWQQEDVGLAGTTLRALSVFGNEPGWAVGDGNTALRVGNGSPANVTLTLPPVNLSILPGRYYVNGTLCELESACSYAQQADGGTDQRLAPGVHLLYLDIWQRHVSVLEAPAIREVALGGPDTATRSRTIAQVRALALPTASPPTWNCDSSIPDWDNLIDLPRPRLAARAEPQLAAANLCEIAATAGYRRLENQLYRVEVHSGGGSPSFKWSRENASVNYAVASVDTAAQQTTVRVAARGRDANLDLAVHDRVELIDDSADLIGRAGTMLEYIADGDDELELVLAGVPSGTIGQDPSRHPVLRRWDHKPDVAGNHVLPIVEGTWIELEDGVQVRFEAGGVYRPGDYWQIPARTITADVEWPRDDNGDPLARTPDGIADAYCRLGLVEVAADGAISVLSDCRELFPPLTALEQLYYVSGDGQDAAPNATLPQALVLRVSRGNVPVQGVNVRFEVVDGDGRVGDGITAPALIHQTGTDSDGFAQCRWSLGPGMATPGRYQRVRASLLNADGQAVPGQVIVYCATASLLLQYISGDGQEAAAGNNLPHSLQMRVVNGGDGISGITLTATIEQGGGALVGPASLTTDANGYASFNWRLGANGPQRLVVQLNDDNSNELQRLEYTATLTPAVSAGGGCDITIGPGGQFERLDSGLLAQLLADNRGMLCLCFLPGLHKIDELLLNGGDAARLSLHGCGPTAVLSIQNRIDLSHFAALEVRDLMLEFLDTGGAALHNNAELRITDVTLIRAAPDSAEPCLHINTTHRVTIDNCSISAGITASAVFESVTGDCHITGSRFDGSVSFYGLPPRDDLSRQYIEVLSGSPRLQQRIGKGQLYLANNNLQLLTIGGTITEGLLNRQIDGLFRTAVLQGNTFNVMANVFASDLLSFDGNSFIANPVDGSTPYGVMIAVRAAAAGNVAVTVSEAAILHFLTPAGGGFSGAANQVFTLPRSTP